MSDNGGIMYCQKYKQIVEDIDKEEKGCKGYCSDCDYLSEGFHLDWWQE